MNVVLQIAFICVVLFVSGNNVFAVDSKMPEKALFIDKTLSLLNSDDVKTQVTAARPIIGKGITEPKIYERIKELILLYSSDPNNKNYNAIAWLIKALASSGDESYRSIIEVMAVDGKGSVKKHAKKALNIFEEAIVLTPIRDDEHRFTGVESWKAMRDSNVLLHPSVSYKQKQKIAVDALKHGNFDIYLYDTINQIVSSDYRIESKNKNKIQAYAFMAKAMAFFPRPDYVKTIRNVSKSAGDKKLRKYAAGYLKSKLSNYLQLKSIRASARYRGEKFSSVNVFYSGSKGNSLKISDTLKRIKLDVKLIKMLKKINLFDPYTENSLSVDFTSYKRNDFSAKISLNVSGQEKNDSFTFNSNGRSRNQYHKPRNVMSQQIVDKLTPVLVYIQ